MTATNQNQQLRGTVKQILSGDSLIIRDRPRGGPPQEWNCGLTSIQAPRLGRRLGSGEVTRDEPWAYEAREYLRRLVGKEVLFACETIVGGTGNKKYYGVLYDRVEPESERVNMNEALVREGLAEVRRTGGPAGSDQLNQLTALQDQAKSDGKGRWSETESQASHVRNVVWKVENTRLFVDSHKQRPLQAVIEHVRDACTYRVLITLPDAYYSVSFMLSGVKSPTFKQPPQQQPQQQQDDGNSGDAAESAAQQPQQVAIQQQQQQIAEPYAEEARFFVEARLLQRSVRLVLETVSGQSVVGSVLHANGNIAEILVQEGLARCVDWSMGVVSQPGAVVKLRQAERDAKKAKRRLWKDYVETSSGGGGGCGSGGSSKSEQGLTSGDPLDGRVVEVGNGDSLVVKRQDTGDFVKLFLASIRPPRMNTQDADGQRPRVSRPLYDIPYMFEAREFLRKRLVGKRVTGRVDYVQPKSSEFPEKVGATVLVGEVNVAEALVQKGLAYVIRYRADDVNRSSAYDALLAAEAVAQKKAAGVHSKKEPPAHKISDLAGDPKRAKQFLPSLQRSGRQEALVEFVASANRFRVYVPRSTCLVTLLLTGVECPRTPRRLPNGTEEPGEPFGEEASRFVKELCLQREVEILVEACDRGGNFIGYLFVDGENLAVSLIERGYGKVHFSAEKSDCYPALTKAEEKAKAEKLNVWSVVAPAATDNGRAEAAAASAGTAGSGQRKDATGEESGPLECTVSEVRPDLTFCVQLADDADRRARLATALREELDERRPPVPGAYAPRKGDLCGARFDGVWHRAKVLRSDSTGRTVQLIDLGVEKSLTNVADVGQLPEALRAQAPLARICRLAFCQAPPDDEDVQQAVQLMLDKVADKPATVRRIYESDGVSCVQLVEKASGVDVAELLLESGLLVADRRPPVSSRSGGGSELHSRYVAKQAVAFKARKNIWRYGDFRDDDE